jgi:hypothetical protein
MPRRGGEKASATVARQTETMIVLRSIPPPTIPGCFISFPVRAEFFFSFLTFFHIRRVRLRPWLGIHDATRKLF